MQSLDPAEETAWREALSALLDGEEPPLPVPGIVAHLEDCPSCSAWLARATALNAELRALPGLRPELGERIVNTVDVQLCGCRTGGPCLCGDCQCGPHCTCH